MKSIYYICIALALFILGWLGGRASVEPKVVTEIRIDTVRYEKPHPFKVSDKPIEVNVPRVIFAGNEGVIKTWKNVKESDFDTDFCAKTTEITSQNHEITIPDLVERTVEYRTDDYYARVVGLAMGENSPRLDHIEFYQKTETRTITKKPRFAITAGAGIAVTPKGIEPCIAVQAGVVLWSK